MATIYYLAYGSNLHPLRLGLRCPTAVAIGVVELPNFIVRFSKFSKKDQSGKCTLLEHHGHLAYGVLYGMDSRDKASLDKAEGLNQGYMGGLLQVPLRGVTYDAFSYFAESNYLDFSLKPYDWYKSMVLCGAQYHQMPAEYISELEAAEEMFYPDISRREENYEIVRKMGCFF